MLGFASAVMLIVALASLPVGEALHGGFQSERPFAAAFARGALIVAVASQPAPALNVGKVDRAARMPDGFAAALAQALGQRAGLPVTLLLADSAAARAALREGRADAAIAGMPLAPDDAVAYAPTAYTSGRGMALVLRHGVVRDWDDLSGRTVCASRNSPFAGAAAHRSHARVVQFDRPLDALLAFQAGECAALVEDESAIRKLLRQPDWAYYRALSGTLAPASAFIAMRAGDIASAVFVDGIVQGWRRQRWLAAVREDQATQLSFDMFNAQNDLYCH